MPAKHASVDAFLAALDDDRRARAEWMRALLLEVEPRLTESIKWNAPSYARGDADRVTMNVQNREGVVQVVLHLGADRPETRGAAPVLDDPTGLVRWLSDIRGVLVVPDPAEADADPRRAELVTLLSRWVSIA